MYRLHIAYGKQTCEAVFRSDWKKVEIEDVDVMEFETKKEGWKFIRQLQKSKEDYCFLTLEEYRQIEHYNVVKSVG